MKQLIYAAGIAAALLSLPLPLISVQAAEMPVQQQMAPKLNINTATENELIDINGIAQKKAQAILTYRKANGPFKSVEELKNVHGISDRLLKRIEPGLTV